jgi:uncharacterized protein YndB with AHSA1/START domain
VHVEDPIRARHDLDRADLILFPLLEQPRRQTGGVRSRTSGNAVLDADVVAFRHCRILSDEGDNVRRVAPDDRELTLRLSRVVPAPVPRVFSAFTEPEELAKWWGPKGFTSPEIDLDLRVGGSYRIAMQPPAGDVFHLSGEFVAVDPPNRLTYTFRWEEPTPDDRETVATVALREVDGSTEVTVEQGVFATEERLALHTQGWTEGLERLYELVSSWRTV